MKLARTSSILLSILGLQSAIAAPTFYADKLSWQTAIRADYLSSGPLGTPGIVPTFQAPVIRNSPIRLFTIDSDVAGSTRLASWSNGIGAINPVNHTWVDTGGHPFTAFGCMLRVANNGNQSVGGTVQISTANDTRTVTVPPAGLWVSFTQQWAITRVQFDAISPANAVEMLDDVELGDMAGADYADQPGDAPVRSNYPSSLSLDNRSTVADSFPFINTQGLIVEGNHDVWCRFVATETAPMTISVVSSNFASVLAVYDSTFVVPGPQWYPIAYNAGGLSNGGSTVRINAQAGHIYSARVGTAHGASGIAAIEARVISFCNADYNRDGVVDFFDYLDFLDVFSSPCT
jgi:hypothetical protein